MEKAKTVLVVVTIMALMFFVMTVDTWTILLVDHTGFPHMMDQFGHALGVAVDWLFGY